jgi:hypothetical protein
MLRTRPLVQPRQHTRLDLLLGHRGRAPQPLAQQLLGVVEKIEREAKVFGVGEARHCR